MALTPPQPSSLPRLVSLPRAAGLGSALLLALFVWAAFTEVDVVVTAPASARPAGGVTEVRAPLARRVAQVQVAEGQAVTAGQTLVVLTGQATTARWRAAAASLARQRALLDELRETAALLTGGEVLGRGTNAAVRQRVIEHRSRLARLAGEEAAMAAEVGLARQRLAAARRLHDIRRERYRAARTAHRRQALSRFDFLRVHQEFTASTGELAAARHELRVLRHRRAAHGDARREAAAGQRRQLAEQITALELEVADLAAAVAEHAERRAAATVVAPAGGVVDQLSVAAGDVVERGGLLAVLVPRGRPVTFEARVAPRQMVFLNSGQACRIKLDALPFPRYGVLGCRLERLSEDVAQGESGAGHYLVKVRPASQALRVDGQALVLKSGATAQVDILAGRRSVLSYVTEPLQRFAAESLRER